MENHSQIEKILKLDDSTVPKADAVTDKFIPIFNVLDWKNMVVEEIFFNFIHSYISYKSSSKRLIGSPLQNYS